MNINIKTIRNPIYVKVRGIFHLSPQDTANLKIVNNVDFIKSMRPEAQEGLYISLNKYHSEENPYKTYYDEYKKTGTYPKEGLRLISKKWENERPKIKTRTIYQSSTADKDNVGTDLDDMASLVVIKALQATDLSLNEIDYLICGTNYSRIYPANAQFIKRRVENNLGVISNRTGCLDLRAACPVGAAGIFTGSAYIRSGQCKRVLVVIAEKATELGDPTQYDRINIFGDGATGIILEQTLDPNAEAYISFHVQSLTNDDFLKLIYHTENEHHFIQNGQRVHRLVGSKVLEILKQALDESPLTAEEKKRLILIFHQASGTTMDLTEENLISYCPELNGKIYRDEESGNTSGVSTQLLISKLIAQDKIKENDIIGVVTFGASIEVIIYFFRYKKY